MATKKTAAGSARFIGVDAPEHADDKRRNIPTAEYQSLIADEAKQPVQVTYPRGTSNADHLQVEKEARNHDLDPQLVWRGKDAQDGSDLVVNAPPLYIQEKVHPKVLIDDLLRGSRERREAAEAEAAKAAGGLGSTVDMFGDFNGIPDGADKTDFYAHDQNWTNRMTLGDSLQVMASLAEHEGSATFFVSIFRGNSIGMLRSGLQLEIDLAGHPLLVALGQESIADLAERVDALPEPLGGELGQQATGNRQQAAAAAARLGESASSKSTSGRGPLLNSDVSRPFEKPKTARIAVKVINYLGDEVMKVFGVNWARLIGRTRDAPWAGQQGLQWGLLLSCAALCHGLQPSLTSRIF
ncbi:MAG: hypothetical protein IT500_17810 [Rubrivivax sp.]|nr:hypothetical protein [Rubrivivax sp.]